MDKRTMNRQELIDSLPEWLRERADELLVEDAFNLGSMYFDWIHTHEGYRFWMDCANDEFDNAIDYLRAYNPEIYAKYYAKYFNMKDSQFEDPKSTQVGGSHYKDMAIQPIDFVLNNNLGFCEGNVVKYISRYKSKGGLEDLKKARHYIDLLISNYGKQ